MSNSSTNLTFDGTGDVKAFITKVQLVATIKGYDDEKLAAAIGSKLDGCALDLYMRLTDAEKKSPNRIKEELLKEYERGNRDREEALTQLMSRSRKATEPLLTYAFKIEELVKLAYPDFTDAPRQIIVKDFFVKGRLHADMQLAMKSLPTFTSSDLKTLVAEACRLETAGVNSYPISAEKCNVQSVEHGNPDNVSTSQKSLVEEVTESVLMKLGISDESVNFIDSSSQGSVRQNFRNKYSRRRGFNRPTNMRTPGNNRNVLKCRNCSSTQHLVRECPTRFCPSCGGRGHDSWDKSCPKYL